MSPQRVMVLASVLSATLLVGCDGKDDQIKALQEQNAALQAEAQSNFDALNRCLQERESQLGRILSLEEALASARADLSNQSLRERDRGDGQFRDLSDDIAWTSIKDDILFNPGRAKLLNRGREALRRLASELETNYPGREVWIIGHTDSDPIRASRSLWQDNLDLSANRAMTVFRELQKLGVEPARMVAGGQGEHNPRSSNANNSGKAQNRRVEVLAIRRPASPDA